MSCSDSHAEALEASDPKFKQRNQFNAKADAASRANWVAACDIGKAIMDGSTVPRPTIERVRWPVGNPYLNEGEALKRSLATPERPHVRVDRVVAASADAAESLLDLADGKGDGAVGLQWLIEHWGLDLDYQQRRNAGHRDQVAKLQAAGRGGSEKCQKRLKLLAVEEPAAALLAKRIAWARDRVARAAVAAGAG